MTAPPVRVLVPAGMLGAGFTAESISRCEARTRARRRSPR
jgi:hypothetical protein